jgi:hypothetical protein
MGLYGCIVQWQNGKYNVLGESAFKKFADFETEMFPKRNEPSKQYICCIIFIINLRNKIITSVN